MRIHINQITILPENRLLGIGKALVKHIEKIASIEHTGITCRPLPDIIEFWKKCGFYKASKSSSDFIWCKGLLK